MRTRLILQRYFRFSAAFLPIYSLLALGTTLVLQVDHRYLAWPVWFQYFTCGSFVYVVIVTLLSQTNRLKLRLGNHYLVKSRNNLAIFIVFISFSLVALLPDSAAGSQIGIIEFDSHKYIVKLERDESEWGHLRLLACDQFAFICSVACATPDGSEYLGSFASDSKIEQFGLAHDLDNHSILLTVNGSRVCNFSIK